VRALGLEETATDRVASQVGDVAQAELAEDVGAVMIYGLAADNELAGDLIAGVALGDQLDHLKLARA
jgi:hypothetical protein